MLAVPEGYREAMAARRPIHVKMEFGYGVMLTDADIDSSVGITITESFNPDTDIRMGKASCRQLSTKIIVNENTKRVRWDTSFQLSFGVEDENGDPIWIYYGVFIGQRPKNATTKTTIDYVAYDQMRLFEANADDWLDTYTSNKSISTILSDIGTEVGMEILTTDAIAAVLTGGRANRWTQNNYTFRTLVENCAELCGCYARIGGTDMDKVEFVWFDTSSNPRIVTRDEIFEEEHADLYNGKYWDDFDLLTWNQADALTWDEVMGYYKALNTFDGIYAPKIDGGVSARYPTNVKTGHIYAFVDNPTLKVTSSNKSATITNILTPLLNRLNSIGGTLPMQVTCTGDLVTQAGDFIQVMLPEEIVKMPIFYKTMRWNGSLTDTYETTSYDN